jgi:hypothetical protein
MQHKPPAVPRKPARQSACPITTRSHPHTASAETRHTLATSLLRHGATLTHIRRYLGHVSDRMAEHYVQLSHSDLEDVLQHVRVAGPGAASPGTLLSGPAAPLTREQAEALAIDLSRRSTPADGGFCTFQPVVDGGACPWNLAPLTELTAMFQQFRAGFRSLALACPGDRIGGREEARPVAARGVADGPPGDHGRRP